jgi:hypothetical protein
VLGPRVSPVFGKVTLANAFELKGCSRLALHSEPGTLSVTPGRYGPFGRGSQPAWSHRSDPADTSKLANAGSIPVTRSLPQCWS